MNKIEKFQITGMTISGFKSYEKPTELVFGNPTAITGGNGRGKTSIADAIAFAVTGLPFFGERGLDRLHNEANPDVYVQMRFVDENSTPHELTRTRQKAVNKGLGFLEVEQRTFRFCHGSFRYLQFT